MIHWLYIYLLTSNSSSPEGKNHPKLSTDPKVVLWLQILKFIILGSTYWGLHAHLFLKRFYLLSSLLHKMWIYPYDIARELCHKWCKLENFRRVFLCPHLLPKNWSKLCLESTWKESASCGSVLTTSPLIQHWYFTHLPNQYLLSHAGVQRRRGWWWDLIFQKSCNNCLWSWSSSSPKNTVPGPAHSFACSTAFR